MCLSLSQIIGLYRICFIFSAAYLSPDTLVIRESGNVSFKAIPEEKPLEVIFMAPELQKKGELSEKVGFLSQLSIFF